MPLHSDQELQALHDELLLFGVPKDRGSSWIDEDLSEIMWPPQLRWLRRAMIRSAAAVGEQVNKVILQHLDDAHLHVRRIEEAV